MTYGSETWSLSKEMERKIQTTQRSMERMMLGYTRRDHKTNAWVRDQTKVNDAITTAKRLNGDGQDIWAG